MTKKTGPTLADRLKKPSQKIEWALKLLQDSGRKIGAKGHGEGSTTTFEIDGKLMTIPEIYNAVSKLPGWTARVNDFETLRVGIQ